MYRTDRGGRDFKTHFVELITVITVVKGNAQIPLECHF